MNSSMGLPERDLFNVCVQVPLPGDAMAVDVEAGKFYSMLLTKDGRMMACGLQEDHQLRYTQFDQLSDSDESH